MAFSAPCIGCSEGEHPFFGKIEPTHCYGAADRTTPGLLGGFICSCPCRNWNRAEQALTALSEASPNAAPAQPTDQPIGPQ